MSLREGEREGGRRCRVEREGKIEILKKIKLGNKRDNFENLRGAFNIFGVCLDLLGALIKTLSVNIRSH